MEKLLDIIETKYEWVTEYKLVCDWAEMALNEGAEVLTVTEYVAQQIFKKAA